jgi:MraZ protein
MPQSCAFPDWELALFQGKFEHTIDEKGRLALPAAFRRLFNTDDLEEASVILTIADQCLAAYSSLEWQKKVENLAKFPQFDARVTAFKRLFIGCAQECPIDKAGRILIPMDLRRDTKLQKDCVVIGQLDKIEIWAAERWHTCFHEMSDQAGSISAALSEFGIPL